RHNLPDVRTEVRQWLGSPRRIRKAANVFQWVLLLVGPAIWVAWAFVSRGGVGFLLFGVGVGGSYWGGLGARAVRVRGAALLWRPVVALCGVGLALDQYYWSHWDDAGVRDTFAWMRTASWVAWGATCGLLAAYFVRALWNPGRSLHDRLARTWLVPR